MRSFLLHVVPEVHDQLFHGRETIRLLNSAIVAVIALAGFIVVSDNPLAPSPVKQRVFQAMRPFLRGMGQSPYPDLNDHAIGQFELATFEQDSRTSHMFFIAYGINDIKGKAVSCCAWRKAAVKSMQLPDREGT
jgi:hypothetical protein